MLDFCYKYREYFLKKVFKNSKWCVKIHNNVCKNLEFAIFEHSFLSFCLKMINFAT